MRRIAAVHAVLLLLAACAMPSTVVRTPDTRPSLAVEGAPPGSALFVDGQRAGDAPAYDGKPKVLTLEPGTHEVEIRAADGATLFRQRVFIESELKTIKVH